MVERGRTTRRAQTGEGCPLGRPYVRSGLRMRRTREESSA